VASVLSTLQGAELRRLDTFVPVGSLSDFVPCGSLSEETFPSGR
jgi:hypothetical protein